MKVINFWHLNDYCESLNGTNIGELLLKSGLGQGCTLSVILFNLSTCLLSYAIKSEIYTLNIPKSIYTFGNNETFEQKIPATLYADDFMNCYASVKKICHKLLDDFKNMSNLAIAPSKSKVSFNRNLEDSETRDLLQLGIPPENINCKLTFLEYSIDMLSKSDTTIIEEKIEVCTAKLKNNMKKMNYLPFSLLGKKLFSQSYLNAVFLYRLQCRHIYPNQLNNAQKILNSYVIGKRLNYAVFSKYRAIS